MQKELMDLEQLRVNSSTLKKVSILKESDSPLLRDILYSTYHPMTKYYLRYNHDLPEPLYTSTADEVWVEFKKLLEKLSTRQLTGGAAMDAFVTLLKSCPTKSVQELLVKVLNRDLGVNVGIKLINEAFPDFIQVFEVMKAKAVKSSEEITLPTYVEPKLDGVRCLTVVNDGDVQMFSRRGHILDNYPQIQEELAQIPGSFQLDGELVQGDSFQSTMSQVRRKYDVDTTGTIYYVFDYLDTEWWEGKSMPVSFATRRVTLQNLLLPLELTHVRCVPSYLVRAGEGLSKVYELYDEFIKAGYEGAMVKEPSWGYYPGKRHKAWLKLKPTSELDLLVVDKVEGEGKYQGMLGALVVELNTRDEHGVIHNYRVNVGGGFSDEQRIAFWANTNLVGQLVEVRYDTVTKNQDGDYSLRFPRFIRCRPDKGEPDIVEVES